MLSGRDLTCLTICSFRFKCVPDLPPLSHSLHAPKTFKVSSPTPSKGDMDWWTTPKYQRKPAEKQQQESLPACARTDKLETRENYHHPGQSREMSHRRTRHSKKVDRVLFRIVYTHNNRRSHSAKCPSTNQQRQPQYPQEEVEAAVKWLKTGKSAEVDNIPSQLVQAGGEAMIDMLLIICTKIWRTGEWPTPWTQSLIITLLKKGNPQICQNYPTISLISHPSKVMLRILLNRLKPQVEEIIKEEQAGFRAGKSKTEQIFNLTILCEKYLQYQQSLYHVFVDFKEGVRQSMACNSVGNHEAI